MRQKRHDIATHRIRSIGSGVALLVSMFFLPSPGCELICPLNTDGRLCQNHICEPGENCKICPEDCGQCTDQYDDHPDGICTAPENAINDPDECSCGNGSCDIDENCETCPEDCGDCQYATGAPDDSCQSGSGEDLKNAPKDCGCGDGTCDPASSENCMTCPQDCGRCHCTNRADEDGNCDPSDNAVTCPQNCHCGNGTCDPMESHDNCPNDCP
ncbi:MAG: hypothetical protein J7M25_05365 [Deltaproteobacteria bacterium]|nr:hypothetical protein [Deltaproteobacteria bacterium]